ncbi:bifunctional diaminohydroxyphosphoribosylaminopyrimidine deaminase/5-amino-6-(5-phosphoribosylamino)uracil reductase, partial [Mycolicibacter hiberniae]|nr:bifunctional diaminohydroxyphosphoribosylaminopyrimidine deaminase/5-amino-6-(5-phosphoribosylamino)uracil reductase [Mycolicibacter hiberniae]
MTNPIDLGAAMDLAIRAAEEVKGSTYPNPPVGAVILDAAGAVQEHAEVVALAAAGAAVVALAAAGAAARGGTAIVTLEPCNHQGRTGPCVDALVAAGVSRVAYAVADPNPQAAGGA